MCQWQAKRRRERCKIENTNNESKRHTLSQMNEEIERKIYKLVDCLYILPLNSFSLRSFSFVCVCVFVCECFCLF